MPGYKTSISLPQRPAIVRDLDQYRSQVKAWKAEIETVELEAFNEFRRESIGVALPYFDFCLQHRSGYVAVDCVQRLGCSLPSPCVVVGKVLLDLADTLADSVVFEVLRY